MALTPLDISNKEFSRSLRGYDIDEVNEFLDHVIKDFEALIKENKQSQEKIKNLEEKASHFSKLEENLTKSIVVAQETSEEVRSNAKKEAKLIIREAEKNADRIINESVMKVHKATMEVDELKRQAKIYRARLRSLIEAQLELIDSDDWNELNNINTSQYEDE
jgi:cell division initiation protein